MMNCSYRYSSQDAITSYALWIDVSRSRYPRTDPHSGSLYRVGRLVGPDRSPIRLPIPLQSWPEQGPHGG